MEYISHYSLYAYAVSYTHRDVYKRQIWNAEDGLPTVERLRDLPIDLQTRIILATGEVDDILIGNAYATEAELKAISEVVKRCV